MKRKKLPILEHVEITDAGAEGNAVARLEGKVVFVPYAAPGDVVDIQVTRSKKSYLYGRITGFHRHSAMRTEPVCQHFGLCGGCRWQHLRYERQLHYKQQQAEETLKRISGVVIPPARAIIPSENIYGYRNKLEFTFSNRRWLTEKPREGEEPDTLSMKALGFHLAAMFDRVLDIDRCHLQRDPSDRIRRTVKEIALASGFGFYDARRYEGFLRNLIIRCTSLEEWMVIMVFGEADGEKIEAIMSRLAVALPEINSLYYVVNTKHNDTISDLPVCLYRGKPFITEAMEDLFFRIGPLSFYQSNTGQALALYRAVRDFAGLTGNEVVYDLYTGTGSIACFIASGASRVIGIEGVAAAIEDARSNATQNRLENIRFFAGDVAATLSEELIAEHGQPDVIITDPPRAGMHPAVIQKILAFLPGRVIYVSCNPATQARDISLLSPAYAVEEVQPVDMFPHTQHVENVLLLKKRETTS
jgi:23S rRNA (uracil1939-C5)-methyltransferase